MRDRKGFTLIELLIVVVIIGILAAIAIPKFSSTREKAYISAMRSDLKNLATQQELYYSTYFVYAADVTDTNLGFTPSARVTITLSATDAEFGFGAAAAHTGTDEDCAYFYGEGQAAVTPATLPGRVTCTSDPVTT